MKERILYATTAAIVLLSLACDKPPNGEPALTSVSTASFAQLHSIEGRWHGARSNGGAMTDPRFAVEYRFINDSTMDIMGSNDTLKMTLPLVGHVVLRSGKVHHTRNDTSLVMTNVAERGATFLPEDGSPGGFTYDLQTDRIIMTTHTGFTLFGYLIAGGESYRLGPSGGRSE